jgi:hypothetical protein
LLFPLFAKELHELARLRLQQCRILLGVLGCLLTNGLAFRLVLGPI